jgi:hypothetical protein
VFKEALPKLVPKWLRERILFLMKDGDPQQRNEILSAMKSVFVNASEGTYEYHVVHMGWRTNVSNCVNLLSPQKLRMWSSIVQQVHKWLYSWMTPGNVEDKEEYELSKYLLEKFIFLQIVLDVVGEHWFLVYLFMGPGHSQNFGNGLWVESVLIVSRMVSHCTGSCRHTYVS